MPKPSRKLRAMDRHKSLSPAVNSVHDLPHLAEKSPPEFSSGAASGQHPGKSVLPILEEAVEAICSSTGAEGALIALIDGLDLNAGPVLASPRSLVHGFSLIPVLPGSASKPPL